jgi:hypothetical protein
MRTHGSLRSSLLLSFACGSLACGLFGEPKADVDNPKRYAANGIVFDYPGNWSAKDETETIEGIELHTVEVESSGSALAIVNQYRPGFEIDIDEVADDLVEAMREGLGTLGKVVSLSPGSQREVEHEIVGAVRYGRERAFDSTALGEKVPHTVRIFPIELDDRTVVLYLQSADEDRAKANPGFDLLLRTIGTE